MNTTSTQEEQGSQSWIASPTITSPNIEAYLCTAGAGDELYRSEVTLHQWKDQFPHKNLPLLQEMSFQSKFVKPYKPTTGHLKFVVVDQSNYLLFDRTFDQDLVLIAKEENGGKGSLMVIPEIRITGVESVVGIDTPLVQEKLSFSSPFGPLFWKKQYLE